MQALVTAGAEAVRVRLRLDASARYTARFLAAGAKRIVVDYVFFQGGTPACPAAIAKFYPDASGAQAYATMRAVAGALAQSSNARLAIPEPLCYDMRQRLLVQRRVEGELLDELARGARAVEALRLTGLALAELHRLTLSAGQVLGLCQHLADLVRPHPRMLAQYVEELGAPASALLQALLDAEAQIDVPSVAAPLHRDVHLRQLFLGEGRIWLIDWDLFARGDPALDVGNFSVYLLTHLGDDGERAVDAFLAGYAEGGGAATIARAPLYAAFTYLRLACKRARLQQPGWQATASALIATGHRVLEEERICVATQLTPASPEENDE